MEVEDNEFIVRYKNNFYDLSKFLLKHPGGVNTLIGLNNSDMTDRFMRAPPHSDSAMYLLKEYRLKNSASVKKDQKTEKFLNGHDFVKENTKTEKITAVAKENYHKISEKHHQQLEEDEKNNNYKNNQELTDDSMEHLVDWSRAMVPQIHKIAEHYNEWVNKPVDRSLRLFEPWYLEKLTRTPWWIIPVFWIPIAACLIHQEVFINQNLHLKSSIIAIQFLSGILLWTFIEYMLHRWIFHMNLKRRNPWLCTLHFMIHGLHHKVPFDRHRLVFPVVPGILIASLVYIVCYCFLALSKITLAGGVCGYVSYDLMHYYLHYGDPKLSLIYQLKRSHYQHHFVHHDRGFGVSSTIWDYVFGTRIFLRKLGFLIKWKFESL